ncbi:helix-turn-helix protein [Alteromonadaceae bacterium 2753L.S.0a.02]|nr:helix-turn-helix protein [Alteromonadaceae bacterium 2753L.S.0a.02]
MKDTKSLMRKAHFLGTKIRNLRKRNHLTIEDLSARCVKVDAESAPSVSYLSMIERGKRVPSEAMMEVIATVFEKDIRWFLDEAPEEEALTPVKSSSFGGLNGIPLEPNFLFSNEILQIAIPELLSQTGTTGRQFAHLLIRAHQEHYQNHFPDLERAAENVGKKLLPLNLDDLLDIVKHMGLTLKWFDEPSSEAREEMWKGEDCIATSYYEPKNIIHVNNVLKQWPMRFKYDLAVHLGHCVLHDKDAYKNVLVAGHGQSTTLMEEDTFSHQSSSVNSQDILHAWRDFECSFFAGALLCPKVPFRQMLDRHSYEVSVSKMVDVSESVAMRRMTAVSPYPHWHYFDAYSPGKLKAVYRGNGIPLPWGNMRRIADPCQHWSVFRMINVPVSGTASQISILNVNEQPRIYCCESKYVEDLAGQNHVLCAGIDLNPAIEAQGKNATELAEALKVTCVKHGGSAKIPASIKKDLASVARILNIAWVSRGIEGEARLICPRGTECPRRPSCYQQK